MIESWGCVILAALLAALPVMAQVRVDERIPTPLTENGKPVSMEVVTYKPRGEGPFPALLFLHGSTGRGDNPSYFRRTYIEDSIVREFTARGWMVVFPQRRGRGRSDGLYDEGFEADRSRYSCQPALSLAGLDHALQDTGYATDWLLARPDVDAKRLLLGGQSRGGILAMAFAGQRKAVFGGVINFVGGWMSDRCPNPKAINTVTFEAAANSGIPSIWLYGRNDPFYALAHSKSNFDAFTTAGGRGTFYEIDPVAVPTGHQIVSNAALWNEPVWAFVEKKP